MIYVILMITIVAEVIATLSLKSSAGFTKFWPSLVVVVGYGISFYLLSIILKTLPVGITYAIWSGVGIVLTALFAAVIFKQIPDVPSMIGMGLIISGVVVIQVFSSTNID